jgi:hypothetical protein
MLESWSTGGEHDNRYRMCVNCNLVFAITFSGVEEALVKQNASEISVRFTVFDEKGLTYHRRPHSEICSYAQSLSRWQR